MGLFVCFILVEIILLALSLYSKNLKNRKLFKFLFYLVAIYFSSFRDGVGQDYAQYIDRIKYVETISIWYEPTFSILASMINNTELSHVFFFMCMSIITIIPLFTFYYHSPYPFITILIFLLFPGCGYCQTFNLVRQFAAIAILIYGFKYLYNSELIKYLTCVFIAFLFHKTAIIMIPIYWIVKFELKGIVMVLLIIMSFILPALGLINVPQWAAYMLGYTEYLENQRTVGINTIILILNFLFVIIFLIKSKLCKSKYDLIIFNMSLIGIVMYNLSSISEVFMRIAMYFMPFTCVFLTYPLKYKKINGLYRFIIVTLFMSIYVAFIEAEYNTVNKILPIGSLWD